MENPRSAIHITVSASVSYDSVSGIGQFSICTTKAHRGVRALFHDIHLPSPPSVLLGSPQAILPARYLKIFCHSALGDLQNPTLSSQDTPASPPPSMGMLCTPSVGMRLPNGGLTTVHLAAHLQQHHALRALPTDPLAPILVLQVHLKLAMTVGRLVLPKYQKA